MKLNIGGVEKLEGGAGSPPLVGFTNVDTRNIGGVQIVCDAPHLVDFEDGSVTEIRASHIIEHFSARRAEEAVREWRRVLSIGGLLRIYCPDGRKIAEALVKGEISIEQFSRSLFGNQDYDENFHKMTFDRGRLDNLVLASGFEIIGREPRPRAYPYDLGVQCVKR